MMDSLRDEISPYRHFERNAWAKLRADTPMTLDQTDIDELRQCPLLKWLHLS